MNVWLMKCFMGICVKIKPATQFQHSLFSFCSASQHFYGICMFQPSLNSAITLKLGSNTLLNYCNQTVIGNMISSIVCVDYFHVQYLQLLFFMLFVTCVISINFLYFSIRNFRPYYQRWLKNNAIVRINTIK